MMTFQPVYEANASSPREEALQALEHGQVVFLPQTPFQVKHEEMAIFSPEIIAKGRKNISFDIHDHSLLGVDTLAYQPLMLFVMERYAIFARQLISDWFPLYDKKIRYGRTSFRPTEVFDRKQSVLKDDTRLHVDAFVSTPVNGDRILRVFSNVNLTEPRVWHLGESFECVLAYFFKQIQPYSYFKAKCLHFLKATKTLRTPYDHYMLMLHNAMKRDEQYQKKIIPFKMEFPAQTSWIVFTDQASHAALKGQYVFEQTFYLPVDALAHPEYAPLRQWEQRVSLLSQ